ncbi:Imm26 family immunity protein [Paenibacillus mangrovi]
MTKRKIRRRKLGDVYAIPLPNGKYAFGRLYIMMHQLQYIHI